MLSMCVKKRLNVIACSASFYAKRSNSKLLLCLELTIFKSSHAVEDQDLQLEYAANTTLEGVEDFFKTKDQMLLCCQSIKSALMWIKKLLPRSGLLTGLGR
jgi:hypothetical protein